MGKDALAIEPTLFVVCRLSFSPEMTRSASRPTTVSRGKVSASLLPSERRFDLELVLAGLAVGLLPNSRALFWWRTPIGSARFSFGGESWLAAQQPSLAHLQPSGGPLSRPPSSKKVCLRSPLGAQIALIANPADHTMMRQGSAFNAPVDKIAGRIKDIAVTAPRTRGENGAAELLFALRHDP